MKKFINLHSVRFLLAGGANTLATYLLYLLLIRFMPYRIAYTVTFAFGILLGYLIQAIWVFKAKPRVQTAFAYPVIYLAQYFLGVLLLTFFVEKAGIDRRLAPLLVVAVTLPLMFLMTKALFSKKT